MLSIAKVLVFYQVSCNICQKKYGSYSPQIWRGRGKLVSRIKVSQYDKTASKTIQLEWQV